MFNNNLTLFNNFYKDNTKNSTNSSKNVKKDGQFVQKIRRSADYRLFARYGIFHSLIQYLEGLAYCFGEFLLYIPPKNRNPAHRKSVSIYLYQYFLHGKYCKCPHGCNSSSLQIEKC